MNLYRSVATRLAVALSLVVIGALLIAYFLVVPSLQHRLVDSKLLQLKRHAPYLAAKYASINPTEAQDFADNAAESTNARVVVFHTTPGGNLWSVVADSNTFRPLGGGLDRDPIAGRAKETGNLAQGTVSVGHQHFAEVAIPVLSSFSVILLSAPLTPQYDTVHVLKHRLAIAGLVALAVALAVGYGGAWAFGRRIRRLERAAERIAGGRFDEPVIDPRRDELGELARAFDRMRVRLAQLDDARREFIANASHELRTPLFSLGGFLELLADEDLDEATRREFLDTMRDQVARLTKLATDLLDLSRLDAGRISVERRELDLRDLAEDVVEEFGAVAQANEHPLTALDGRPVPALGDPERVLQIGRALVENALVHTPPGTPVRVSATTDGDRAVLSVEDEGPGIPAGSVDQVFERFHRTDGGRSSGSGLGLAIARELAKLMDGAITLDSRPGRTVFALRLPAGARAELPEAELAAH
jgi:two-component system OmpR family sensor kinase